MELDPATLFPKLLLGIVGDADEIMKKADGWDSATQWRWWQNTQATAGAVVSGVVPFPYVLATTPASMLFTYRKMAHVAWGIGKDLNAHIEPLDDMLLITGIWAGGIKTASLTAARFATPIVSGALVSYAGVALAAAAKQVPVKEIAIRKIIEKAFPELSKTVAIKIGQEGGKQFTIRVIPLGGFISGGMTLASMTSFSRSATVYYSKKRQVLGTAQ